MNFKHLLATLFALPLCLLVAQAQEYSVAQEKIFAPQNKKILLLKDANSGREIILFQTNLRVNTDGSPLSYHPQDPRGRTKAINNVCNAMVIKRTNSEDNLCFTEFPKAIQVFEQFRDSDFQTVPSGFRITWKNVLATVRENAQDVPCVFKTGDFAGYFGSLTALRNDLTTDKGECEVNDQVNPLMVPALVLAGGQNPVAAFGAKLGDLVLAYNPQTKIFMGAIIGDIGPKDNLGEGSVSLNMNLTGTITPPTNREETFALSIENTKVLIAIIPGSHVLNVVKPYTAENISQRIADWRTAAGFDSPGKLLELMKSFQPRLN